MAEGGNVPQTNRQIQQLGATISQPNMESIAMGFLNIDDDTISSFRVKRGDNTEAFNRDIIIYWANKNPRNQVKVNIFYVII